MKKPLQRVKRVVVASDSFKGSLTSLEVAESIKEALEVFDVEVIPVAVSDGGEGFARVVTTSLNGSFTDCWVHDPLGRLIQASYGRAKVKASLWDMKGEDLDCAIIDMASASGLTLLKKDELDPWNATSFGTGELICHAAKEGLKYIILGLGGSATVDCGFGILEALKDCPQRDEIHVLATADVKSPLCGKNGAAICFARQKGADDALILRLEERNFSRGLQLEDESGCSIMNHPFAGAAGGAGAAILSLPHGKIMSGIQFVLESQQFNRKLSECELVITGEGCVDRQTLLGKAPYEIALAAQAQGVPCVALAGRVDLSEREIQQSPWSEVVCITPEGMKAEEAMLPSVAKQNIIESVRRGFWYLPSR